MKAVRFFTLLLLVSVIALAGCAESIVENRKALSLSDYAPADGVLVKFKPAAQGDTLEASALRARALQAAGISENAAFGLELVPGLTRLNVPSNAITDTLIELRADSLEQIVEFAEPNFLIYPAATFPNDPQFGSQWALNNTGQLAGSLADSDVDAPEAWDLTQGDANIIVAVIDSGVDYTHPDLDQNIWTNFAELNGQAGVDDDNNGYVDDIRGWNFSDNNNNPMDQINHGTHVAGVIGAEANAQGVTGLNWNVQIMPLKFIGPDGLGTTAGAIEALNYAVANGARISNNSWGGAAFSQALFDAIEAAGTQQHIFVAAAGNDALNNDTNPQFPANIALDNVISVAATDSSDNLASFSNFGPNTVDLAAPGVGILSTLANDSYASLSGTSMATPFVSGAAALLLAYNSSLTVSDVRSALLTTVDPNPNLLNRLLSGGRLNVFNALNSVAPGVPVPPTLNITPNTVQMRVGETIAFTIGGGSGDYAWSSNAPAYGSVDNSGVLTAVSETTGTPVLVSAFDNQNGVNSPNAQITILPAEIQPSNVITLTVGNSVNFNVVGGSGNFDWAYVDANGQTSGLTIDEAVSADTRANTVTAQSAGQFRVQAIDLNNSLILQTQLITVEATPVVADPLTVSPAGEFNLSPGQTINLTVSGGTAPFEWFSNDSSFATVTGSGTTATITAVADTPVNQPVGIRVVDATGQEVELSVNILTPLSFNAPGTSTIVRAGDSKTLSVTGGVAPYTWTTNGPNILATPQTNTSLADITVTADATASSAVVTVTDAVGAVDSITLNINDPAPPTILFGGGTSIGINSTGQFNATGTDINWTVTAAPNGTTVTPRANNPLIADVSTGNFCGTLSVTVTDVLNRSATANVSVTGCFGGMGH
jgi:subtilisin family serine protease